MCKWAFTQNYCWLNWILLFSYSLQRVSQLVILNLQWGKWNARKLLFIHHYLLYERVFILKVYQIFCSIWYHEYNFKNVKNTHGGMSLLVTLQVYITKSNTPWWVFLIFYLIFRTVLSFTCLSHKFLVRINENELFQHVAFLHLIHYGNLHRKCLN